MVEKIGLYAPAIWPLSMAFAMALGLEGHHGSELAIRAVLLGVFLVFAFVQFRKIRSENQSTAD